MKRKVLKNIPKPDEEKLAIFYGRKTDLSEDSRRESGVSTVDKKTTVDKMSTVVNESLLKGKLKSSLTHNQQSVYKSIYTRSSARNQDTTDWVGYSELAKELNISLKTVQRAIDRLILLHFVERIDITNTAEIKGSKYRLTQPAKIQMSTVDKNIE